MRLRGPRESTLQTTVSERPGPGQAPGSLGRDQAVLLPEHGMPGALGTRARERNWPGAALLRRDGFGYATLLIAMLIVAVPLLFLIYGSFSSQSTPTHFSLHDLTLRNYVNVYTNPDVYRVLKNTVIYVVASAALGTSLAVGIAYLIERTDVRLKGVIFGLVIAGFGIPGLIQAVAWEFLLDPRSGLVNQVIHSISSHLGSININSLAGMIFVFGIGGVPIGLLLFLPVMRNMDPSLEEAAMVSGAGSWVRTRTITLRLLLPGILAVLIYQMISALEIFEVPGILGLPGHIYVFATLLYTKVNSTGGLPAYNYGSALSMIMLAMAAVGIWLYFRVLKRASRFGTVSGRGYRPRLRRLGKWRPVALAGALLYALVAVILPVLVLLYSSFLPYLRLPSTEAFGQFTLANYHFGGTGFDINRVILNTVILMVVAAVLSVVICFFVSYVVVRTKFVARRFLDLVAFVPHGVPGIVAGVAFFWIFINLGPLFGTVWSMAIAFAMGFLAYGTRMMNAAFLQLHPELEEASRMAGVARAKTVWHVTAPLARGAVVNLGILIMLLTIRAAALPLVLYSGQKNVVLSVMLWDTWNSGSLQTAAALGCILVAVVFCLMLLGRRHLLRGLVDR